MHPTADPTGRHRGPSRNVRWTFVALLGAKILAALVSLSLIVAFGYGWKNFRDLDGGLPRLKLPSLNQAIPPTRGATTQAPSVHGKDQNILVAGIDNRSGLSSREIKLLHLGHDTSVSADVLLVVHVPANGSKATLLSIPRDSYVDIPGHPKRNINAAYSDGYYYTDGANTPKQQQAAGADLLVRTVHDLTGLTITGYVQIGFGGFYTIAKAIHGITVNLCQRTSDPDGSGFVQSAGVHNLTPVESLQFVRQRHFLTGGDLARTARARYFIAAAFRKIASAHILLNPSTLHHLVKAVDNSVIVANIDIVEFAGQLADLSANNIVGRIIPTEGTGQAGGNDVVFVDPVKVRRFATELINSTLPTHHAAGSRKAAAKKPVDAGCVH